MKRLLQILTVQILLERNAQQDADEDRDDRVGQHIGTVVERGIDPHIGHVQTEDVFHVLGIDRDAADKMHEEAAEAAEEVAEEATEGEETAEEAEATEGEEAATE